MLVLVAYATLYPETKAALDLDGIAAEYVYVGQGPEAYHDLLERTWAKGQGFVNVEQDIVVYPGAIAALIACPEPWCGAAYSISTGWGSWLGCVRFSDDLVAGNPGVFTAISNLPFDGTPRRYWGRLDTRLKRVLEDQYRLTMHIHWPSVGHRNPAQQPPILNWACGHAIPFEVARLGPPYPRCPACQG